MRPHIQTHGRTALHPELRHELGRRIAEQGEAAVAAEIGIAPQTLARILAGLTVVGGSRAAVIAYLDRAAA